MTTSLTDLTPHLDKLTGRKVLCIGDVMLDRFVRGEVSRLSPEAPIPVLLEETEEHMLGGAANTAANAAALGADVYLIAVIGKDRPGQTLKRLVREHIGAEDGLIEDSRRKTEIKTRYLTRNQQLLRVDKSPRLPPADESRNQLLADVRAHLQSSKAVIISDYGKGMLEPSEVATIIAEARKAGVPVIVDPKGSDYNRYRGASVITPNRDELTAATGKEARDDAEIEKAAHDLTARFDIDTVLVTRSEDGVSIVPGKGDSVHLPTLARDVFDVSGAGDTVVAMLAVALAAELDLKTAARLANVAAGIVVGKTGTAVVRPSEIEHRIMAADILTAENKIKPMHEAAECVSRWQRKGLKVGFCNGCFDLLHPGHIVLIDNIRKNCDRLVMAINADESVKKLKGPTRPIQTESARALVLAAIASVDLVVVFTETDPCAVIAALKPDLVARGADYTQSEMIEADLIASYGGKIMFVDLKDGHSTTRTVERMRSDE